MLCARVVLELQVQIASVAALQCLTGHKEQDEVADGKRAFEVLLVDIDMLEVVEHAYEQVALGYRLKVVGMKFDSALGNLANMFSAIMSVQDLTVIKRIDIDSALWEATPHHEVIREAEAVKLYPYALANLHVEQRERDRDTGMFLQDPIQETILRISVVLLIAVKVLLVDEHCIHGLQNVAPINLGRYIWLSLW